MPKFVLLSFFYCQTVNCSLPSNSKNLSKSCLEVKGCGFHGLISPCLKSKFLWGFNLENSAIQECGILSILSAPSHALLAQVGLYIIWRNSATITTYIHYKLTEICKFNAHAFISIINYCHKVYFRKLHTWKALTRSVW